MPEGDRMDKVTVIIWALTAGAAAPILISLAIILVGLQAPEGEGSEDEWKQ